MKRNREYKLFGWLSVLLLMLTTACASVDDLDLSKVGETGESVVTLTVQTQSQSSGMRDATILTTPPATTIGKATKINTLIYAVYEKTGEKSYKVITDEKIAQGSSVHGMTAGTGQTIVEWYGKPKTITLTLEAGKQYRVVFWAQNAGTKAYNTSKLEAVHVKYSDTNGNMPNNDETRDAFCAYVDILSKNATESVVLRRPLAQINVGTAGWDYEGAAHLHPSPVSYTKSRITLKGVAQYYNVLDEENTDKTGYGKTLVDNQHPLLENGVTFELNTLPAFMNLSDEKQAKPQIEKYDEGEEFLVVDVNKDDEGFQPYVNWDEYQKWLKDEKGGLAKDATHPATEIFKYLSMCYVLVPEAGSYSNLPENKKPNENATYGAVLKSVKFEAYGIEPEDAADNGSQDEEAPEMVDVDGEEDGEDNTPSDTEKEYGLGEVFTLTNVPVQKNWRTNILGYNLFVFSHNYQLDIVPDYCGDYNQVDGNINEGENWSGNDANEGQGNPKFDDDDGKYNDDPYTGSEPKADDEEGQESTED